MVGLPIPKVGFAPTEIAAGRRVPVPPKTTQPAYTPCAGTTRCGGQARFAVGHAERPAAALAVHHDALEPRVAAQ